MEITENMKMKNILKKIIYKEKATSELYIAYIRSLGVQIGEECTIYSPTKTLIDLTRPWLINIGNNVKITEGVTILTHGFDWSVLKGVYWDILGSSGGGQNRRQCFYRYADDDFKGSAYREQCDYRCQFVG